MAGTTVGGHKVIKTIKKKYGDDFFKKIGHIGGSKSRNGGFACSKVGADGLTGLQRAKIAGAKGGMISKRSRAIKKKLEDEDGE